MLKWRQIVWGDAEFMFQIDLNKAKTEIARLIQSALDGEEVIITENDQPILKLARVSEEAPSVLHRREAKPCRQSGSARGLISISDDFDKPLEDFAEYMQ
jgi:antitoxin (DNA-binding transcriptional repressor) of toxin-antitoxin stability system